MLQKFGEHVRGWLAWIVIALIAVALCAWGISSYLGANAVEGKPVAVVNGEKINEDQLNQAFKLVLDSQFRGKTLTSTQKAAVKKQVLQMLVLQTVMSQSLKNAGFTVGMQQAQEIIATDPNLQQNGRFSQARFAALLQNMGQTPDQFFKTVRERLVTEQFRAGIVGTEFALADEVNRIYQQVHEHRDFRYLIVPAAHYEALAKVSDQQVAEYYKNNQTQFAIPEKVQVQYIVLSPYEIAKNIKVTPQQVKAYYNDNKANFTTPASWKVAMLSSKDPKQIQSILSKLSKGESFSTLMKQKIPGVQTQTLNLSAAAMPPQLQQILTNLKVGQVSKPMPTQNGSSLLYILDAKKAVIKPFDQVKENVAARLKQTQAQDQFMKEASQLSDLVFQNATSLEPAAKALGLQVQTSPLLTKTGEKKGLFANPDVMTAVFSKDVLKEGFNSKPISLQDSSAVVVRVLKHTNQQSQPLSAVKAQIVEALKKQMAIRQAGVFVYQLQNDLQKERSIQALTHSMGLGWVNKNHVTSNDKSIKSAILQKAFSTPAGHVATAQLDDGFALVQVNSIQLGDLKQLTDKQRQLLQQNISSEWGQELINLYFLGQKQKAKIKYMDNS